MTKESQGRAAAIVPRPWWLGLAAGSAIASTVTIVIVIWECELKHPDAALTKLLAELSRVVTHATPYPTAEEAQQRLAAEPGVEYLPASKPPALE